MTGGMNYPSNPMAAMVGAYAAAFEQGSRAWLKQAEVWRAAFARPAAWPPASFPSVFAFEQALREMTGPLIDSLSVQFVEMEDKVAFRVTCLDMRIDMMITRLTDAGPEKIEALEEPFERIETIKTEHGGN